MAQVGLAVRVHYERLLAQEGLEPIQPLPAQRLTPHLERSHRLCRTAELRSNRPNRRDGYAARPFIAAVILRHLKRQDLAGGIAFLT